MTSNDTHLLKIADELSLRITQVRAVAGLLQADATIPFIARYRKEATDSLDEVQIAAIRDRLQQLEELDARKAAILKSLEQHGHLTDELAAQVSAAETLTALEDIYLPYRPKRRTKATIAREKGLEPLAEIVFAQEGRDPEDVAAAFVDAQKGVETTDDALSGARDIIAEWINEDPQVRSRLRDLFEKRGVFVSAVAAGMEESGAKYKDYFEWEEPAARAPSHRILAMRRGEREDILNLTLAPQEEDALGIMDGLFVNASGDAGHQVTAAVRDCYKRLLSRSMETEARLATKERAETEAIRVFADNLRQLLLAPPLGAKRMMGIDPGLRTGCKVVCLDAQGKLIHHGTTIYPHTSEKKVREAADAVKALCERFKIEAIAIGNGTAGRETESFIRELSIDHCQVVMVNESGASVYSASEVAREEFPDLDLTVRGAASIGRRLMDPLSELVKIDPKSIGVGQYQHDVDQTNLRNALDDTVMSCVNNVGVDVNRASAQLLTYVSGLGPQLANNIVEHRNENGPFQSRKELKKVKRLGAKAFEQSAGFLRISEGSNPLDKSAVHPESYAIVDAMAADLGCGVADLMTDAGLREKIDISRYVTDSIGRPTLKDIVDELAKPGRDPRETFQAFAFEDGVSDIRDLRKGMKLPGIVTNVTAFGAFVDVGVHQDGLVHISQLADRFVKNPADVVKTQQQVMVTVLDIEIDRKRIALSMKKDPGKPRESRKKPPAQKPRRAQEKPKPAPFNNAFGEALKNKR
ncbi:MAG: Tex family protein [Desulfobacterales bacterium]